MKCCEYSLRLALERKYLTFTVKTGAYPSGVPFEHTTLNIRNIKMFLVTSTLAYSAGASKIKNRCLLCRFLVEVVELVLLYVLDVLVLEEPLAHFTGLQTKNTKILNNF
jgi:hypothetical protein